jgi:hypothetical protein
MSLFSNLFKRQTFKRHLDSFALTRETLWTSIAEAIQVQHQKGKTVFLVSHFLDSFSASQSLVEAHRFDYEILAKPISNEWLKSEITENTAQAPGELKVQLALSDLLIAPENKFNVPETLPQFAIMVVEIHPLSIRDQQLAEFAESLPGKVELGYFMALDDAVLQRTVSKETIDVLRQLGLGENDLITSSLISKRLRKLLRMQTEKVIEHRESNSADEWYELHDAELA